VLCPSPDHRAEGAAQARFEYRVGLARDPIPFMSGRAFSGRARIVPSGLTHLAIYRGNRNLGPWWRLGDHLRVALEEG
jgi:hypothetical protein